MVKISFCVTYYNQAKFVEQSINSILAIEIPCDYEILIGDDGSTDDTLEKIREFKNLYPDKIKYFIMPREKNKKYNFIHRAADNRLNIAEKASGDYIMFLDGDDFYCDQNFVTEALEKFNQNKKLVACAFNFYYFYEKDKSTKLFDQNLNSGIVDNKLYVKKHYTPSGAIVFKNILDAKKIKYLKNSKNFDDNVITIYFLQFGDLYYIDKPIYAYRQTDNSIWNSMFEIEQHLLNTMDYEIISRIAPIFKKELAKRQYNSIHKIYKNRKNLEQMLGSNIYNKYLKENSELKNKFVFNILNWNKLSFVKRFIVKLKYMYLRCTK